LEEEVFPPAQGPSERPFSSMATSSFSSMVDTMAETIIQMNENINKLTKYVEYLAENIDKTINYTEYVGEQASLFKDDVDVIKKNMEAVTLLLKSTRGFIDVGDAGPG
jgi:methyl-accepting chemotaxis protein